MEDEATTKPRQVRIADGHWQAYQRVCARLDTTRAEDIVTHIRQMIREHGDEEDLRLLDQADAEIAERRARMHPGRARKAT